MPDFLVTMLRQYKKEQAQERLLLGNLWQGSSRIFVTWDGAPGHPDWPSRWFARFIKKHKLPHLNFHGLRHTCATMLINQNIPVKSISGRLGHNDASTTLNIYAHYLKSADREIANRLEQVYWNITEKNSYTNEAKKI